MNDFYTTVGFWVGVAGTVFGALGIGYGVWSRSHPKRSGLVGRITVSAVLPDVNTELAMQVTMGGYVIVEPHLVRLTITNLGPYDLSPAAFEGGYLRCVTPAPSPKRRDADLRHTMAPIANLHSSVPCAIDYPQSEDGEPKQIAIEVKPCQLQVGESATMTWMVAGKPDFGWSERLTGFTMETVRGERPDDLELSIQVPLPIFGNIPIKWRRVRY